MCSVAVLENNYKWAVLEMTTIGQFFSTGNYFTWAVFSAVTMRLGKCGFLQISTYCLYFSQRNSVCVCLTEGSKT